MNSRDTSHRPHTQNSFREPPPKMNDSAPRLACIVFARMREFTRLPVREQARLAGELHTLVESVVADLPADARLVLEVQGGAAIVVPDDPPMALLIAERLHARAPELSLCIGLNHGPVKLAEAQGHTELIGDGLQAAATTAEFATPERWLAARAFRDALAESAPEEADRLAPAGVFTDARVRSHELYAVDLRAARRRRMRLYAGGTLAVLVILSLGVGARVLLNEEPPEPPPIPEAPAVVTLDIKPMGDVTVDGVMKGKTPPLSEFELKAGKHMIVVRNGSHPPLETELNVAAGERVTLSHRFGSPQQRRIERSAPRREESMSDKVNNAAQRWRRKLGI